MYNGMELSNGIIIQLILMGYLQWGFMGHGRSFHSKICVYIYMCVYYHPEVCRKWNFQKQYRFSELCFYILPLI